jgi:hypothetical protein
MNCLFNNFNISINPYSNHILATLINATSLHIFYYVLLESCKMLYKMDKQNTNKANFQVIKYLYEDIFEDLTVDNNIKIQLLDLLDINSIDRHYILYYIFKLDGVIPKHNNIEEIQNIKDYYKLACKNLDMEYGSMNLDETLENNYQIALNSVYECNIAHINFISWLYYSGIYTYLIKNNELKQFVLSIMNSKQLLKGNLFLKYQLYLVEMEKMSLIEEEEEVSKESITEDKNEDKTLEHTSEENNESNESNESNETDENNYELENADELNARNISEDLDELNEITFATKLIVAVKNITIKSIKGIFGIIREEMKELFHNAND